VSKRDASYQSIMGRGAVDSPLELVQTQDIAAESVDTPDVEESDSSRRLSFNDSFMEYAPTLISSIKLFMFGV
jgi:hypothetical protein